MTGTVETERIGIRELRQYASRYIDHAERATTVDSSALVKLVLAEEESRALSQWLGERDDLPHFTSDLAPPRSTPRRHALRADSAATRA